MCIYVSVLGNSSELTSSNKKVAGVHGHVNQSSPATPKIEIKLLLGVL